MVSNAYVESPPVQPCPSGAALMVARVMLGHGYEPGMGFGQNDNGMASLVEFTGKRGRFALGYKPTRADVRSIVLERKGRSMGQPQGLQVKKGSLVSHQRELCQRGLDVRGIGRHDT